MNKDTKELNELFNNKLINIAVIDAETDPFLYGRAPQAFAWGFYDGTTYADFWGDSATDELIAYIESIEEPLLIYAHNGGKFDFFYLIEKGCVNDPIMLINGRVVKLGIGRHELRDSYAIIPIPLAAYQKDEINYDWFERAVREKHKADILHYLATDCENLYSLVRAFVDRFGAMLTVGSTAIKEIGKLHPIKRGDQKHDEKFRPWYYGGRVSVLEPGITKDAFNVYDVNSMYPYVMRDFKHPSGQKYLTVSNAEIDIYGNIKGYPNRPYFAELELSENKKALPTRTKTGLSFDQTDGLFFACSHEIKTALKHRLIKIKKCNIAYVPTSLMQFNLFVDKFIIEKIEGKQTKNKIKEIFAKFMLNSGYGKFGQNPEHYQDYHIKRYDQKIPSRDWYLFIDYGEWEIWAKPSPKPRYFDVAIAASITSAARSVLLDALQAADRPMYCDTDSIICRSLDKYQHENELGAWKLEASGDTLAIAGKKLYALFNNGEPVKYASKGADLSPQDILKVSKGETIRWQKESPTFRLGAGMTETKFIQRNISRNVGEKEFTETIDASIDKV